MKDWQLISFCRPYLCNSSGRRRSWNCWLTPSSPLLLEDHSTYWSLFDWRNISLNPILICPLPVSSRVLWDHMVHLWSWRTAYNQSALFLTVACIRRVKGRKCGQFPHAFSFSSPVRRMRMLTSIPVFNINLSTGTRLFAFCTAKLQIGRTGTGICEAWRHTLHTIYLETG